MGEYIMIKVRITNPENTDDSFSLEINETVKQNAIQKAKRDLSHLYKSWNVTIDDTPIPLVKRGDENADKPSNPKSKV